MAAVAARLRRRFPDVPGAEIDEALAVAHRAYDGRPIRHFVPILVEREITDVLRAPRSGVLETTIPRQRTGDHDMEPAVPA